MILVPAVIIGLLAGAVRAWYGRHALASSNLRHIGLVLLAFVPQWLVFFLPATRGLASDGLAAVILVGSQVLLLIFIWANREQAGFWALGLGLACNLLVITLNGGLMPIDPETVARLKPDAAADSWQVGHRLGGGKDVVLPIAETRLPWLRDRFLMPAWFPYQAAFSLGDVLIAVGAFWFLWALGGRSSLNTKKGEAWNVH